MSSCECGKAAEQAQRSVLWRALVLNAAMAVIGGLAGWLAQSTGLLADALDMLADAAVYVIALVAIGRSAGFKANAAAGSGVALTLLGLGLLFEVGRRALHGSEPQALWMLLVSLLSLAVNVSVLRMLTPMRDDAVHLGASWLFTRADVVANLGVIVSALVVALSGSRWPDLVIGLLIGLYVLKEAWGILARARAARREEHAASLS